MARNDEFNRRKNHPRVPVLPPADRHFVSRIRKSILADEWTTFIGPDVDVAADVTDIAAGLAERDGVQFRIRGRIYQIKPTGRLFPVSGDGFIGPVARPVIICLRALARYNGVNDLSAYEIRRQGIAEEHILTAHHIWEIKERGRQ